MRGGGPGTNLALLISLALAAGVGLGWRAVRQVAWHAGPLGSPSGQPPDTTVFRVLRSEGLAAALDTLEALASSDSLVLRDGHQLAHALGRAALAEGGNDPRVLAQCRPVFASGCYHGVVEAYLNAGHRIDMEELERMCGTDKAHWPGRAYECVHGVGHGVLAAHALDARAALRDCDGLSTPRFRSSCYEGVFMEAINSAGGTAPHWHHGGSETSGSGRLIVRAGDPYSPCDGFGEPYAASCWLFQPFVILKQAGFDAAAAFRLCDGAPAGRAARCYEGMGLQLAGVFQRDERWDVAQCAKGRADLAPHCAAGVALALAGMDWSGTRARKFCVAAPEQWKDACYGAAAGLLRDLAPERQLDSTCAVVERQHVARCRAAAGLQVAN